MGEILIGGGFAAPILPAWAQWLQFPVAAALVTGIIAILAVFMNRWVQADRIKADKQIAKERFDLDTRLAERRLAADLNLAERKVELDRELEAWRRKSVFAEEALADFYRAQTAVSAIRSPGIWGNEYENRAGRDDETPDVRRRRDQYVPYLDRIRAHGEFLDGLHARRFRAIALFGAGAEDAFERIRRVVVQVQGAALSLLNQHGPDDLPQVQQHKEAMLKRIWEGYGADGEGPDALQQEVASIIAHVEQLFRPALATTNGAPTSTSDAT